MREIENTSVMPSLETIGSSSVKLPKAVVTITFSASIGKSPGPRESELED